MDRRSILRLLGGAAVVPSVGVKTAAAALGVDTAIVARATGLAEPYGVPSPAEGWWRSPLAISLNAKDDVDRAMASGQRPYPHMRSWGHGFRTMAAQRDQMILSLYRAKMDEDHAFRNRVFKAFGLPEP
jgi:hypothetical protein